MLLRYRGREGMFAWLFHRIAGVAIWAFVVLHVVDIYLVGGNPGAYNELLQIYASPARPRHRGHRSARRSCTTPSTGSGSS